MTLSECVFYPDAHPIRMCILSERGMYMVCTWFLYIPLAQLCVFSRNVHNEYFVNDRARTAIWSHLKPFAVNGGQSLTDSTEERENSQAAPPADAPSDAPTDAPSM